MKTLTAVYAGFVAVLITCAFGASAALAAPGVFLWNGAAIVTEDLPIKLEPLEELLLEVMEGLGSPDILCSGIFDALIENGGEKGTINELLMLDGTLLSESVLNLAKEEVVGDDLECVEGGASKICQGNVLVVAIGMPWNWTVELHGLDYTLHILNGAESGKEPGIFIDCVILGILTEDLCEGLTGMLLENAEGGVLGEFQENEEFTPAMNCTIGGEKSLLLLGANIITDTGAGLLTVSEA